jgi:hypothetical protein
MKAKDIITPGDYEVRPYKGGERNAHIVRVEKRSVKVFPQGSFSGYNSEQWRAIAEYKDSKGVSQESDYPLAQVIRPWAEAEPEHVAYIAAELADKLGRQALTDALHLKGIVTKVYVSNGRYELSLTSEQADALTDFLLGPDDDAQ